MSKTEKLEKQTIIRIARNYLEGQKRYYEQLMNESLLAGHVNMAGYYRSELKVVDQMLMELDRGEREVNLWN